MSQNRTVVPGMENTNGYSSNSGSNGNDFYARGERGNSGRGTVVPGMNGFNAAPGSRGNESANGGSPQRPRQASSEKPVVGFLYSISRQGVGEFWPLHIGQNTIGSSESCDVPLLEGSVSGEHAVLVVRKMRNPEKTIASLSDARSTNGTMINGESLAFSAVECFNGDIITVGLNYELVLLLVDAVSLGLKVAENFIPIERDRQDEQAPIFEQNMTRADDEFPPRFSPDADPYNSNGSTGGTVGMDGNSNIRSGGTVGM